LTLPINAASSGSHEHDERPARICSNPRESLVVGESGTGPANIAGEAVGRGDDRFAGEAVPDGRQNVVPVDRDLTAGAIDEAPGAACCPVDAP